MYVLTVHIRVTRLGDHPLAIVYLGNFLKNSEGFSPEKLRINNASKYAGLCMYVPLVHLGDYFHKFIQSHWFRMEFLGMP
jgi:hypothetical protein